MAIGNALKYEYQAEDLINVLYQKGIMGDSNTGFLQQLIDNSLVLNENIPFWQECFNIDGNEQPADLTDRTKNPAWTVRSFKRRMTPMASAMAPLSETLQMENEGWAEITGSMYQYGSGLYQNSLGQKELEAKLLSLNIKDQTILGGYVKSVADAITAHNSRVSNMAAQTISKGGAYSNVGQGAYGVLASQKAYIDIANFKKAGADVWTSSTADLPEQMKKIEMDFKESKGLEEDFPMQWDIPYSMALNYFLTNAKFLAEVNRFITLNSPDKVVVINNSTSSVNATTISLQQLVDYSKWELSKIAPIHIIKEKQSYQGFESGYTTTHGWADGIAVLRPLGLAGTLVHGMPKDIAMFQSGEVNNSVSINIAKALNFLYVVNKVTNDGMFKAYHMDVLGTYATVLNEIQYHVVVDTTEAG